MNRNLQIALVVGIAVVSLSACRSRGSDEKAQPSKTVEGSAPESAPPHTALGEAARDFAQKRDRYLDQMNAKLDDLDGKIASLKKELAARSAEGKTEAKGALTDAIAELQEKRAAAREALKDAREATQNGWQEAKSKTDQAIKSIDDQYQDAARQLRQ